MLIHAAVDRDIDPARFGGAERDFGLARGLAVANEVCVLCVVPNRNTAPSEARAAGMTLIRRRAWYTSVAWRLEQWGLAPLFAAAYGHRWAAKELLRALPSRADVFAAGFPLTGLFDRSRATLLVYLSQNVEADHFRDTHGPLLGAAAWAGRVQAFEARAVRLADLVVVVGDEDAARMRELYGVEDSRLVVIPNGWDERSIRAPRPGERTIARAALGVSEAEYVALFVGSDAPTNRAALAALFEHVVPALEGSGVRLVVAGAVSRAVPARRPASVIVRAELPDLSPVLHAADAGLNPVVGGGGSNVKVPTYLGAGLAVVTTPFGLRGFAALEPHVVVAPLERMAEALRARPRGWAAAGSAEPSVVRDLAWGRLGARLGAELEERLAQRAAPEPRRARA